MFDKQITSEAQLSKPRIFNFEWFITGLIRNTQEDAQHQAFDIKIFSGDCKYQYVNDDIVQLDIAYHRTLTSDYLGMKEMA